MQTVTEISKKINGEKTDIVYKSDEEKDAALRNSDKDKEDRAIKHWQMFLRYKEEKEQPIRFFNKEGVNRNILDYVKDSVDRMNEYQLKPSWKEDWQANVFDGVTRSKLISILSILASSRMKAEVLARPNNLMAGKTAEMKRIIFSDLLESANDKNDDASQLIWEMYAGLTEGTVFGFESWVRDTREVEYVKEYNQETGEVKTEKIKQDYWDDVYGEITPIDEVYPETIWVNARDFHHKVRRMFWAKEMTYQSFIDKYGKFTTASEVRSAVNYSVDGKEFDWGVPAGVRQDNIYVMHFYDESSDKMGIWANGMEIYYGPLPWNHKKKPFWVAIAEPIHAHFLFGKSLPDKLMSMQDVNNAMFNSILDQLFLALNSPIVIDGEMDDEFWDGYLEPGRVYQASMGAKAQRIALGQVDNAAFSVLSMIKRSMEEGSISSQAQGIPTGGRKTKFEVQQLQEGALQLASLFLQLMEGAMKNKYWLRLHNILQYYSERNGSGKNKFKYIELENKRLMNGKTGTRAIQIVDSKNQVPTREQLKMQTEEIRGEKFDELESDFEPIVITKKYLIDHELELDIRIVPNSSVKESETSIRNRAIAFYQMTAQNPQIDQTENLKKFVEAFQMPVSLIKKAEQNPMAAMMGQGQKGLPGMPGMSGMPAMQPQMDTGDLL